MLMWALLLCIAERTSALLQLRLHPVRECVTWVVSKPHRRMHISQVTLIVVCLFTGREKGAKVCGHYHCYCPIG